jgi:hypothetical protein
MDELRRCRLFPLVVLVIAALVTGWRAQAEAEDMDGFKSLFDLRRHRHLDRRTAEIM